MVQSAGDAARTAEKQKKIDRLPDYKGQKKSYKVKTKEGEVVTRTSGGSANVVTTTDSKGNTTTKDLATGEKKSSGLSAETQKRYDEFNKATKGQTAGDILRDYDVISRRRMVVSGTSKKTSPSETVVEFREKPEAVQRRYDEFNKATQGKSAGQVYYDISYTPLNADNNALAVMEQRRKQSLLREPVISEINQSSISKPEVRRLEKEKEFGKTALQYAGEEGLKILSSTGKATKYYLSGESIGNPARIVYDPEIQEGATVAVITGASLLGGVGGQVVRTAITGGFIGGIAGQGIKDVQRYGAPSPRTIGQGVLLGGLAFVGKGATKVPEFIKGVRNIREDFAQNRVFDFANKYKGQLLADVPPRDIARLQRNLIKIQGTGKEVALVGRPAEVTILGVQKGTNVKTARIITRGQPEVITAKELNTKFYDFNVAAQVTDVKPRFEFEGLFRDSRKTTGLLSEGKYKYPATLSKGKAGASINQAEQFEFKPNRFYQRTLNKKEVGNILKDNVVFGEYNMKPAELQSLFGVKQLKGVPLESRYLYGKGEFYDAAPLDSGGFTSFYGKGGRVKKGTNGFSFYDRYIRAPTAQLKNNFIYPKQIPEGYGGDYITGGVIGDSLIRYNRFLIDTMLAKSRGQKLGFDYVQKGYNPQYLLTEKGVRVVDSGSRQPFFFRKVNKKPYAWLGDSNVVKKPPVEPPKTDSGGLQIEVLSDGTTRTQAKPKVKVKVKSVDTVVRVKNYENVEATPLGEQNPFRKKKFNWMFYDVAYAEGATKSAEQVYAEGKTKAKEKVAGGKTLGGQKKVFGGKIASKQKVAGGLSMIRSRFADARIFGAREQVFNEKVYGAKENVKYGYLYKTLTKQATKSKQAVKEAVAVKQLAAVKSLVDVKQAVATRQAVKQLVGQKVSVKQAIAQPISYKNFTSTTTKVPTPRPPKNSQSLLLLKESPTASNKLSTRGLGYQVFLRLKGKEQLIGEGLSRTGALDLGTVATTQSLAATFKIKQTNKPITNTYETGAFSTYKGEFRDYAIRKGQRIKLADTYIQKRGSRLGTRREINLIQKARSQRFLA